MVIMVDDFGGQESVLSVASGRLRKDILTLRRVVGEEL